MELPFRVIAVFAKDWNQYTSQRDYRSDFDVSKGWVVGWVIQENDEKLVLAQDWFPDLKDVRDICVIPKETIIYQVELAKRKKP